MALSAKVTTASLAVTAASARAAYPAGTGVYVRVYNLSTTVTFVRSGDSAVVATLTDQYIPANGSIIIAKDMADTNLAAIGTSATLYFGPTDSPTTSVG